MLNSIVGRGRRNVPLNEVERKIISVAAELFLSVGFSSTTIKMISQESDLLQGTIS